MARLMTYSRFVTGAKVVLPLAALGLLSTIFLVSRGPDPSEAIPFADVDVDELTREQRITAPAYAGVTGNGTAITIAAERATPDSADPSRAVAEEIRATLETRRGEAYRAEARRGRVDGTAGTLALDGGLRLESSRGLTVTASGLTGSLTSAELEVQGPIAATAPFGALSAGHMTLRRTAEGAAAADEGFVAIFTQGVRMVYTPRRTAAPAADRPPPDPPIPDVQTPQAGAAQ